MDLELRELGGEAAEGVCLSAESATSHKTCRAWQPGACQALEVCMQPLLARDEHLFKVCPHASSTKHPLHAYVKCEPLRAAAKRPGAC